MEIKLCTCDPTHYAEVLHCFDTLSFERKEGVNAIPLCRSCQENIAYNQVHWRLGYGNRIHFRLYMLYWYHLINASLVVSEHVFNLSRLVKKGLRK